MNIDAGILTESDFTRLALELVDVGAWMVDIRPGENRRGDARWSDHTFRMLGLEPQSVRPTFEFFMSVIHPDDRERVKRLILDTISAKSQFRYDCRVLTAQGGVRTFRARGRAFCDAGGRVVRLGGTWADVTEQSVQEQKQRAIAARFQSMFEQSTVGIAIADVDGRFLQVNASFATFLGYDPEDLSARTMYDVTHPADLDRARAFASQVGHDKAPPATYDKRFVRRDGGDAWGRVTLSRLHLGSDEDATSGFLAMIEDITQQRATRAALERQTEMLRGMLEHLPVMIARFSAQAKCIYANRECERVFGWAGDQAPDDIVSAAFPDPVENARVRQLLEVPDGKWVDLEPIGADGRRVPSSWACIVQSGGERMMIGQDLRERRDMQERLAQSQKMEALGQLAGGVAHDFNNLLTIMTASAAFIESGVAGDSEVASDAREIQAACQRAASLTRRLLAFSRREIRQPEVVDLNDSLRTLSKSINRIIGENIQLALELQADGASVEVDRQQLEQVVLNLVVNARDAIKDNGTITISTRNAIGIRGTPRVLMAVRDDGCGIDPAIRHRIFEPFFTTKGLGKGTGLGLATVLGVVEQSGGTVEVHSGGEAGTVFEVSLPAVAAASFAQGIAEEPAGVMHDATVLLVEDEAAVRAVVRRMLTGLGYAVIVARHGADALQIFGQQRVDIVVTDVIMPEMGGRELANRLRESHPQLPVLFVSGYTDDELLRKGILEPGVRLLRKPFAAEDLASAVHGLLTGRPTAAVETIPAVA